MLVGILAFLPLVFALQNARNSEGLERAQRELLACSTTDIDCFTRWSLVVKDRSGMEGLVVSLQELTNLKGSKWDCHDIAHHIGEALYLRDGMDGVEPGAEEVCVAGLYDGMFTGLGQRVASDKLYSAGLQLCDRVEMTRYSCLHGLGHASSLLSKGDIQEGLVICDQIPDELTARNCGLGVVMEVHPSRFGLVSPCTESISPAAAGCANLFSLVLLQNGVARNEGCSSHQGYVREDCDYGYGWWASSMRLDNGKGGAAVCGESAWCARGWGWGAYVSRPDKVRQECENIFPVEGDLRAACLLGSTQLFVHDSVKPDKPAPLGIAGPLVPAPEA